MILRLSIELCCVIETYHTACDCVESCQELTELEVMGPVCFSNSTFLVVLVMLMKHFIANIISFHLLSLQDY